MNQITIQKQQRWLETTQAIREPVKKSVKTLAKKPMHSRGHDGIIMDVL